MQFLDASMIDLTTVSDTNLRKSFLNESKTVPLQSVVFKLPQILSTIEKERKQKRKKQAPMNK
jgi:hypothetical protein